MRVLFATAVVCLALAACGQVDPLPPGMASRITATGGVFSLAVPPGWHDVPSPYSLAAGQRELLVAPGPVSLNPTGPPRPAVSVIWGVGSMGINNCCGPPSVSIAGQPVAGGADDGGGIDAWLTYAVNGTPTPFLAACYPGVPQNTCLAILDSWRWESPSSSRVLRVVAEAAGAVALASGALVLVVVRGRRRTTRP